MTSKADRIRDENIQMAAIEILAAYGELPAGLQERKYAKLNSAILMLVTALTIDLDKKRGS